MASGSGEFLWGGLRERLNKRGVIFLPAPARERPRTRGAHPVRLYSPMPVGRAQPALLAGRWAAGMGAHPVRGSRWIVKERSEA